MKKLFFYSLLLTAGILFASQARCQQRDADIDAVPIESFDFPVQEELIPEPQPQPLPETLSSSGPALLVRPALSQKPQNNATANPNMISLDIKGMDIIDVLKMLATRAGINIVVGKNVTGRVTLFLKDVDVWDAFEIILLANDLAYEKKDTIVNVMTQRDYELAYGQRYQDKKQIKIFALRYARAVELAKSLIQIKTTIGRVVVDESSNSLTLIDVPKKLKEMEELIRRADSPVVTKVFSLNYAQADKLGPKLQEAVTKGVGSLKIDERTNKIAITDFPAKIDELAQIISEFDEKTPQVLIDAQIVEISPQKDHFTMGIDWDYWIKKNSRLLTPLAAQSLDGASNSRLLFGVAASESSVSEPEQYKAIIDLLKVIGETKILSSPRIMALNNQEAKILVGTKEAYITSTTTVTDQANPVVSQTVNFVDVGLKLYVTPTVNRDRFITMKIKPEVSSAETRKIIAEDKETEIPIVTTSEAETSIMVKDGTTIMIAGLKKDQRDKEVRKIPFLGDIPFLGIFARNTKDERTKTELVIFITPRIVSGEEPLEYTSLTDSKDIGYIQSFADAKAQEPAAMIQSDFQGYKHKVMQKIKDYFALLRQTKDLTRRGEVTVDFVLFSNGELKDPPKVASSTNQLLDEEALECIRIASPFGGFPKSFTKPEEIFRVTLSTQ